MGGGNEVGLELRDEDFGAGWKPGGGEGRFLALWSIFFRSSVFTLIGPKTPEKSPVCFALSSPPRVSVFEHLNNPTLEES